MLNILLIYLPCSYLFVYKLSFQRPLISGVEGLLVYNSLYSMGLVFYATEWLLVVLTFAGKHLFASYDLQNLLNELNIHQYNLLILLTGIQPNVDDCFYIAFLYFIFYIVFSNWFKVQTIHNYFGINFFDLFYTNMIMKNIWIRVFRGNTMF